MIGRQVWGVAARLTASAACVLVSVFGFGQSSKDLEQLSLDELLRVPVSLQRRDLGLRDVPAAVYVITPDQMRRMGFDSIPEALRMVPGLEVARMDRSSWAISARGFNGRFANKLLVLVDGQSVYTPNFSGVFWDAIDIPVEALERIEVIRGPGGTLWGPNAVNGIINIITKRAGSEHGVAFGGRFGDYETGKASLVYDTALSPSFGLRLDATVDSNGAFRQQDGSPGHDGWSARRVGARMDWSGGDGTELTVTARGYDSKIDRVLLQPTPTPPFLVPGFDTVDQEAWSTLARLEKPFGKSKATLQVAYDRSNRTLIEAREDRKTFDADLVYDAPVSDRFQYQAGIAYRTTEDELSNAFTISYAPARMTLKRWSGFLQGVWNIDDRNQVTAGVKALDDTLSGFELQPSVRWMYKPNDTEHVWAAVTRAVRTPARADHTVEFIADAQPGPGGLPAYAVVRGSPNFGEETVVSFESGYRRMWGDHTYFDAAAFLNFYDNLRTFEPEPVEFRATPFPHFVAPFVMANKGRATTAGVELYLKKRVNEWWDVAFSYALLDWRYRVDADSGDTLSIQEHFTVPRHQAQVQTSLLLGSGWSAHAFVQYVDALGGLGAPSYWRVDARFSYTTPSGILLEAGIKNAFRPASIEYPQQVRSIPSQIPMTVYLGARGRF
ncbi:MAG: TonB-dependent receptor [Armatimonadetes bacterium]|nr:MAG: TonB-dependent receptor [Armatimonadota bacterium]